jgi:hypothetical protein
MVCGPALTVACGIRNTTVGFVVGADGTTRKDSSTGNMRHIGSGCITQKTLHGDE